VLLRHWDEKSTSHLLNEDKGHALLYVQEAKGKRNDVRIVSKYDMGENAPLFTEDTVEQLLKTSTVYVLSPLKGYCPQFLLQRYDFEQSGVLWKVGD